MPRHIKAGGDAYYKGNDALGKQSIYQIRVKLDAFLGHRIVSSAKRNYSRPREGEAV